ncbi:Putative integrase [Pseudomonas sp. FH1]|nr:Putative integrase [Pseudomonas sp. FH1]
MTDDECIEQARQIGVGSTLDKIKINAPVTFADLEAVGEGIAHVTEYGFCVHDFSMLPCQKNRDCLNCSEQVCIKGDVKKLERLKRQRSGILLQLKKAQHACEGDVYGADRWSQHQRVTLERVEQLIHILERSGTPDGSIIKLNIDNEFSPLKREIAARTRNIEFVIQPPSTELVDLDEIRLLMEF